MLYSTTAAEARDGSRGWEEQQQKGLLHTGGPHPLLLLPPHDFSATSTESDLALPFKIKNALDQELLIVEICLMNILAHV